MMRRIGYLIMSLVLASLFVATGVRAANGEGTSNTLASGQTFHGTYYAAAQNVTIDGDVDGDLICLGQNVVVNGSVSGDVLCAAQTLFVKGAVGGSVRVVGQTVTIDSSVARNVTSAGQTLTLSSKSKLAGEVALAGQNVSIDSDVAKDVSVAGQNTNLNGKAGSNVNLAVSSLALGANAKVAGNLTYWSNEDLKIDQQKVAGKIDHKQPAHPERKRAPWAAKAVNTLFWLLSATLLALLLSWLFPRPLTVLTDQMLDRPWPSIGWGFVSLLLAPIVMLLLALSMVGIPAALLLGTVWIGFVTLNAIWLGLALGRYLMMTRRPHRHSLTAAAAVGVPIVVIAASLPVLGGLISLVGMAWGLGALVLSVLDHRASHHTKV